MVGGMKITLVIFTTVQTELKVRGLLGAMARP